MPAPVLDPVQLLVMANRVDGITREMTNTLVRTCRSTTQLARDFSTSICTAQAELLTAPEGFPCHVYGSGLLCEALADLHPDFQEGDAFLHNDPYLGNTHAADHTILVPVFWEGGHVFTCCVKAHQVDCGNALPTTYMPTATDVYAEGALIFPCVKVQENYQDVGDIIRMCQKRIRVPVIWYGDYLSQIAAARVGEQRLKDFCRKYGLESIKAYVREWMDYCERLCADQIAALPAARVHASTALDPFPNLPDGIPLQADIDIDPGAGAITVDLRDNPDATRTGLNLSQSTAINSGVAAVLTIINSKREAKHTIVPNNAGTFRRIQVLVRENCVVGIPRHPTSCSVATNTVSDRVIGMIEVAFAQIADGIGVAEPCWGSPPFQGVVSGFNRARQEPFVVQLFSARPAAPLLSSPTAGSPSCSPTATVSATSTRPRSSSRSTRSSHGRNGCAPTPRGRAAPAALPATSRPSAPFQAKRPSGCTISWMAASTLPRACGEAAAPLARTPCSATPTAGLKSSPTWWASNPSSRGSASSPCRRAGGGYGGRKQGVSGGITRDLGY